MEHRHILKRIFAVVIVFSIIFPLVTAKGTLSEAEKKLPRGYGSVELGMSVDMTKEALKSDLAFNYKGDRDVSLLPGDERVLISVDGVLYIGESFFQFDKDRLYIITLMLNKEKIDYYSVFSSLCNKYGEPDKLSPDKSQWENNSVIVTLEKPLTLRYTDVSVFTELQESSNVEMTKEEKSRQNFLNSL